MRRTRPWPTALAFAIALGLAAPASAQQRTAYRYDALGRLIEVARSAMPSVYYAYDAAGNRTSVQAAAFGSAALASYDFAPDHGYTDQTTYPRFLGDVNGDGRQDMVAVGNDYTYVALAKADGTFGPTMAGTPSFAVAASWTDANLYPRMAVDLNHDGKDDLIGFGNDAVFVALSQGDGTFGTIFKAVDGYGVNVGGWTSQEVVPRLVGDVDGDGYADIVGIAYNSVLVSRGRGDGTFNNPFQASLEFTFAASWANQNRHPRMLADVNGDGRADLVGFAPSGVYVALGQANGTFAPAYRGIDAFGETAGGWTNFETFPRFVKDMNGDGLADVVGFGNSAVYVSLARKSDGRFDLPVAYATPFVPAWGPQSTRPRLVGDTDGDHRADLLAVAASGVQRQANRL